jgi:hypothetical protein
MHANTHFARWVFLLAGIVGILEIAPLYFIEGVVNQTQPPAITHPEFYYGFLGVALPWQVAFLIISRDPPRYLALLPALFLEKFLYPAAAFVLHLQGRLPPSTLAVASLDLVWLVLFVISWAKLRSLTESQ